jgi:DNA-binding transcriptional LysR family regulator
MQSNASFGPEEYALRMFDPRRLYVLQAIAEHRSLTRAAAALVMTQPAVSRQLAALEREVGVPLVARNPRRVALTAAGEALVEEAAAILPAVERADRRLRGHAAPDGGAIRLGAVPSAMVGLVPEALEALRAERPRVELRLEEGWSQDLARRTARGDLDLAVVAGPGELLVREELVALLPGGHPLADRTALRLADLAAEPWLVAPEPAGRQAVLEACARAGFAPRIVAGVAWEATAALIAAGVGVALAPAGLAARLRDRALAVRALADRPERPLSLVHAPVASPIPAARDLARLLHRAATA